MQYGYDINTLPKVPRGESILKEIDYTKLRIIAGGGSSVVLTDGIYAIKVGHIDTSDVEQLNRAADVGFAMPVLYYERFTEIDQRIIDLLTDAVIWGSGYRFTITQYISKKKADMLITLYAESYLNPNTGLDFEAREAAYKVSQGVATVYTEKTGNQWVDSHPWNLGVYNGGFIIFDF